VGANEHIGKKFLADVTSFSKHFIFTYKLCHDAIISQKFQLLIVTQVNAMQIILKRYCINQNIKRN